MEDVAFLKAPLYTTRDLPTWTSCKYFKHLTWGGEERQEKFGVKWERRKKGTALTSNGTGR